MTSPTDLYVWMWSSTRQTARRSGKCLPPHTIILTGIAFLIGCMDEQYILVLGFWGRLPGRAEEGAVTFQVTLSLTVVHCWASCAASARNVWLVARAVDGLACMGCKGSSVRITPSRPKIPKTQAVKCLGFFMPAI